MRKKLLLFLCLMIFALSACAAPHRHYPVNPSNPIYTVAILPVYNATNDVEGPKTVREEFFKRIKDRHYSVRTIKETDELLLNQMGITLGSQLDMTNPQQLGEILGVDGVVYGYLLNFDDVTTGLYNVKKVRAGFKLIDTKTGRVMWAEGHGVKSALAGSDAGAAITLLKEWKDSDEGLFKTIQGIEEINGLREWKILRAAETKKVGDAAAFAIGEKLLTKALGVHLMLETNDLLNTVLRNFPNGPGIPRAAEIRKVP